MKLFSRFSGSCLVIVFLLLLSIAIPPCFAGGNTDQQLASLPEPAEENEDAGDGNGYEVTGETDVREIRITEIPAGSGGNTTIGDLPEKKVGIVTIRAKDVMDDQYELGSASHSASSFQNDTVNAQISAVASDLNSEGYQFTGASEHRYKMEVISDNPLPDAKLKSAGTESVSADKTITTVQNSVSVYRFTNPGTGAVRLASMVQLLDPSGVPVGKPEVYAFNPADMSYDVRAMIGPSPTTRVDSEQGHIEKGTLLLCPINPILLYFMKSHYGWNPCATHEHIPAQPVLPMGNAIGFGATDKISHARSHSDYSSLGGASALRRTGEIETFIGHPPLSGTDWIQSTYGAAIKKDGTLVTWTPGSSKIGKTYAATAEKKYIAISRFSEGDWLLAIYKDANGDTWIDMLYNGDRTKDSDLKKTHEELYEGWPKEAGWKKISAGNNHALAIRSDGRVYT